jgi:hypothetical protein
VAEDVAAGPDQAPSRIEVGFITPSHDLPRLRKDEYQSWVDHLNTHPNEMSLVIEAIERYDASR